MGVSKSITAHVSFSRPSLVYQTGEQVTGFIYFRNKRKKYRFKKLFLEFIGELEYLKETTELTNDGIGNYRTQNQTIREKIQLINNRHLVLYPSNNESEITLEPGYYSWPFEFILPQKLPPSIDSSFSIKYYIMIVVDRPWFPVNCAQDYPLTILPTVDLSIEPEGRESVARSRRNSQQFELKVYLHNRGILPGQHISLDIDINNPRKLTIEKTKATLLQYQTIVDAEHTEKIFEKDLSNLIDFNQTELHETFELLVPYSHLIPSCSHQIKQLNSSIRTEISYELQLDVKFKDLSDRMNIFIPIIIGTEPLREPIDDLPPISYENAVGEMNLPPSYESAIANL